MASIDAANRAGYGFFIHWARALLYHPGLKISGRRVEHANDDTQTMISTLASWIGHWAQQKPDTPVITFNGCAISWAQFKNAVVLRAEQLTRAGVRKGDRVACLLLNRPEFYEVFWACQTIGAIFVPLNTRLTAPELEEIMRDAQPAIFIGEHASGLPQLTALLELIDAALPRVLLDAYSATHYSQHNSQHARQHTKNKTLDLLPTPCSLDDAAAIVYTSGTTGLPKGAVLTHGNVIASAHMWMADFKLTGNDRHLMALPLCFTGGLIASSMHIFCSGASMVLMEAFDPVQALQLIAQHRLTWFIAVPLMLQRMHDDPAWAASDLSSLRGIQSGGAAVPVPLIAAYRQRGVELMQGFGITEGSAGSNLFLAPEFAATKAGSIGRAGFSNEARVIAENGELAAPNEVGELQLRGALIFREYWRRPAATAETFEDGWLKTGDLAQRDADGFYFIVGRKKDMIVTGGLNVYPAEVERVLDCIPGIIESAVIGVTDAAWGEAVVAVLRVPPDSTNDAQAIEAACRKALAGYKVPKRFEFVADFPRTVSGKILKRVLREMFATNSPRTSSDD
jgi:fatty-acyl-CoA synthase